MFKTLKRQTDDRGQHNKCAIFSQILSVHNRQAAHALRGIDSEWLCPSSRLDRKKRIIVGIPPQGVVYAASTSRAWSL
ncbi:hypothetical protein DESC_460097 [Desulfosarcina cetonica]|nr:hypothetical protein DESC_460097 [Desulfosarcina cetonica]